MYKYFLEQGTDKDPLFYFYTDFGLAYYVAFRNMSENVYPLHNLYSLDFGEINKRKSKNDSKISSTILAIIRNFIETDNSRVIHFLCDNEDQRQLHRKRLFSRWFSISAMNDWVKYDYDFKNVDYNISFIYSANIYNTKVMENQILSTLEIYENAKDESN